MNYDKANARLINFYHQLFPDLVHRVEDTIENSNCAALGTELSIEDIQRGWESQPNEFDYELEVVGQLPAELKGTLYRNGPGLLEVYGTPLKHPIDGDGMICAITLKDGRAWFKSKYVKTSGYVLEKQNQKAMLKGMMGTVPKDSDVPADKLRFKNPSNTNVYYWGGRLLATWESGLPYSLDPDTLETIRKDTLNGALAQAGCLAAHFRLDTAMNRLVTLSFRPEIGQGNLYIHEFDEEFGLIKQNKIVLDRFYYCHDFLLTDNYYIVHQSPFYNMTPEVVMKMTSGEMSSGESMRWYPEIPCSMIVISRWNPDEIHIIPIEPCHVYHHVNAFEHTEGNRKLIKLSTVCLPKSFNMDFEKRIWLSNASVAPGRLLDFEIDLQTNKCVYTNYSLSTKPPKLIEHNAHPNIQPGVLDDRSGEGSLFTSCEFPSYNLDYTSRPWRYSYLMASTNESKPIPYQEIVKVDHKAVFDRRNDKTTNSGEVRSFWSARSEFGVVGEPVFVPRAATQRGQLLDEDDGWVLTQLYNCKEHRTEYVVLDAKNLEKGPIARLRLKHHTPYGFHGTFHSGVSSKY
eukprot:TRINITY_DN8865_c0_g1_i1.p1 TRINITY_DN8865_c0_g1~~TRINITY_DN8865_c0_g1_i1.p1  ORF type:complete len:572 (-),score=88.42 TRINITY_DN8865_c0_g1_i1:122-1837(-)